MNSLRKNIEAIVIDPCLILPDNNPNGENSNLTPNSSNIHDVIKHIKVLYVWRTKGSGLHILTELLFRGAPKLPDAMIPHTIPKIVQL